MLSASVWMAARRLYAKAPMPPAIATIAVKPTIIRLPIVMLIMPNLSAFAASPKTHAPPNPCSIQRTALRSSCFCRRRGGRSGVDEGGELLGAEHLVDVQ